MAPRHRPCKNSTKNFFWKLSRRPGEKARQFRMQGLKDSKRPRDREPGALEKSVSFFSHLYLKALQGTVM